MKEKENFVLSAIITNECNWQIIDNAIKQIKIKHFPQISDEEVEFHAKDMVNRDDIFKNLSWYQVYAIFGDVFNLISDSDTSLAITSVVIEKSKIKYNLDIETWAYKLLFERLDNYMNIIN